MIKPEKLDAALLNYFFRIKDAIYKSSFRFRVKRNCILNTIYLTHIEGLSDILHRLTECRSRGSKVIFIGNGGSAAICSHMAIDFLNAGKIRAIDFNSGPLITCLANDYGFENFFAKAIEIHGRKDDIIVAISSSGKSQDILRGVEAGQNLGCQIITLSGFRKNNPLSFMGDINIYVPMSKYGEVEVSHYFILHFLLDCLAEKIPAN